MYLSRMWMVIVLADNTRLQEELEKIQARAVDAMKQAMYMVQADTQQLCPVQTGNLKRSYQSGVDQDGNIITGWVGSDCQYAVFADLKQAHLTAAVEKDQAQITELIRKALTPEQ